MRKLQKGFTLIELLLVIAILLTLAVVVLVALNPIQQLARTRDAGRISAVTQLGHAMEAYGTTNVGAYVAENTTWITSLVTAAEIASTPANITNSLTAYCGVNAQNGFCYDATTAAGGSPVIIFSRLEATTNISRCALPTASGGCNIAAGAGAWAFYSTNLGKGGIACTAGAAAPTVAQFGTPTSAPTICILQ